MKIGIGAGVTHGGIGFTPLQLYQNAVLALNPLHYYTMQETTGSLIDSGSAGDDVPLVAGTPNYNWTTAPPPMGGAAIDFDGATDSFRMTPWTEPTDANDFVMCAWLRFPDLANNDTNFWSEITNSGGTHRYRPSIKGDTGAQHDVRVAVTEGTSTTIAWNNQTSLADTWLFKVFNCLSASDRNFRIQKIERGSSGNTHTLTSYDQFSIGSLWAGTSVWLGQMAHFAVFDGFANEAAANAATDNLYDIANA